MEKRINSTEKENIREENDRKKRYLWQYQECKRELERLEEERIEVRLNKMLPSVIQDGIEVRLNKMLPSVIQDGMPHASGCNDLSGYASKLDDLDRKIMKARYRRIQTLTDIRNRINAVKDQSEREVLTYRYIRGMKWEDIAVKMGCSWQWTHKIHSKALKNIEI